MFKYIKEKLQKAAQSRMFILIAVFAILAFILIQKLFNLQIINGEDYLTNFTMSIKKERTIKSTRGEIYDRNGKALAYNKLAYSVTFEDSASYGTMRDRNLELNSSMYGLLRVIEDNGNSILTDFGITLDSSGNYSFTREGVNLLRFKADIYGQAYVEDLKDEERNATAEKMIEDLCSKEWYGILNPDYTEEELASKGLPSQSEMDKETILKLVIMRSKVAANSYQKYMTTTLAKDVNEETVAIIMENKDVYPGVDVVEDSIRVYDDSIYFAPILGYTGQISQEELAELNKSGSEYDNNDIVGKSGLEQTFENELQGVDGSETLYVDNLGKVLRKDSEVAPQAGKDIYLTIDRDLQMASYKILEQYIAGIVYSNMIDEKEFNKEWINSSDEIKIPVYDVYYALFENNVLDAKHLASDEASDNEKRVYQSFLAKEEAVFAEIKDMLTTDNPVAYKDLEGDEWKAYQSYIVNNMLITATGILNEDAIDKSDATYKAWTTDESISMQEYLTYAISKGWLDVSKIELDTKYLDTREIMGALADYIAEYLTQDDSFSRQVYKYMIQNETISGAEVCLLLFDQGVLEMNEEDYNQLSSGGVSAYDFIRSKIYTLEITPAQLALEPCTGSVVITDPDSGDVLACVTYPGYDNNRLANDMDSDYYTKLNQDKSSPFYNKATQEVTAPGSTFKMVTATAGVEEGVISIYDTVNCVGKFELADPPINCWIHSDTAGGQHGPLSMVNAIKESCNFYFNTVGYLLGKTGEGEEDFSDSQGVERLTKYADMYGFDATSGIEISETAPHIATKDPARFAMGQSDHTFTTTQLARYVNTIANGGTCFDLTLLDRITDSQGNTLDQPEPVVHNQLELPSDLWDTIHQGMAAVANNNSVLKDMSTTYRFQMAGKTGTAQEQTDRANHALFVGYAPYENPEMSIAVRITNGYSSKNAASVARDIVKYRFDLQNEAEIISGNAVVVEGGNTVTD
ncbi:MAG: penicillin-binding transpeptidase domain-containing protein [Lachnospiraceae bacterium]|nr:penicillin-binding transpeptidase domain-containing protein [Lachnospiraceae bacterium]